MGIDAQIVEAADAGPIRIENGEAEDFGEVHHDVPSAGEREEWHFARRPSRMTRAFPLRLPPGRVRTSVA
jgi:hypothetical protein